MARRKVSSFAKCIKRHLKGKKGGRAAFKKAVRACKKGRKSSRRRRRSRR